MYHYERFFHVSWACLSPSPFCNFLNEIEAISANDIWAVGHSLFTDSTFRTQTLIEHWNGASWSVVPSPNRGSLDNGLLGIEAVSANNLWAVGEGDDGTLVENIVVQCDD